MKVRFFHDSIRFRLSRDEVITLARQGQLENVTRFSPTRTLVCALSATVDVQTAKARFDESRIVVLVPAAAADRLRGENELSISHEQLTGPDSRLKILIEKDFECLDSEKNEAGVSFFPNPKKTAEV
jgi:hypothetical protein